MSGFVVYKHTSPSEKVYIGITNQKPERRWRSDGSGYRQNEQFYNAIKKYGWDSFKHEILYTDLSLEDALKIEKDLIQEYQLYKNGYNKSVGGDYGGYTESVREKISRSVTKLWSDETYRDHMRKAHIGISASKGFKHTEEAKQKMSAAASARWKDEEYKKHMVEKFKKRPKSFYSEKIKKQWDDPDQKQKLTAHLYGNNYRSKRVICVETGEVFESVSAAAKSVNGSRESIGRACRGLAKKSHGKHWRFADDD